MDGTIIRANGLSFELQIDQSELRQQAESLDGQSALVTGDLRLQPGVETGPRWIVEVRSLAPARKAAPNGD